MFFCKSAIILKIENYINNLTIYDEKFEEKLENKLKRQGHIKIDKQKSKMKISYKNGNYIEMNGSIGYFYDRQIDTKHRIKIKNLPFASILMAKKLNLKSAKIKVKDFEITKDKTIVKITAYGLDIHLSFLNEPFKIIGWDIYYPNNKNIKVKIIK